MTQVTDLAKTSVEKASLEAALEAARLAKEMSEAYLKGVKTKVERKAA